MKKYLKKLSEINIHPSIIGGGFCFLFGIILALFFAMNKIRIGISLGIVFLLIVSSLKISRGVILLLIYLPFMAFIRRLLYIVNPYTKFDPLLVLGPFITLFMWLSLVLIERTTLFQWVKKNKLVRWVTCLVLVMIVSIFNPLQGGLSVGVGGIIFWVIPFLWVYFGLFLPFQSVRKVFWVVGIVGVITSFYGIVQIHKGLLPFEEYWLRYGGYAALRIKQFVKAFATFSSAQEFSQYISIAVGVVVGGVVVLRKWFSPFLGISLIVLLYSLTMTSIRTQIIFTALLLILFFSLTKKKIHLLWIVLLIVSGYYVTLRLPYLQKYLEITSTKKAHLRHIKKGLKAPLAPSSTGRKYLNWGKDVLRNLIFVPTGLGTGSTTLAAGKFKGLEGVPGEFFLYAIPLSFGVLGLVFYVLIGVEVIKYSLALINRDFKKYIILGTLGIWGIFCVDLRLYTCGPLICLLWGKIAEEWEKNYGKNSN